MTNKDEDKTKLEKVIEKAVEIARSPVIRKSSRFASSILEMSTWVKSKNPLSIGVGIVSTIDAALDAFEVPYPTKTEQFAKKHDLKQAVGSLPRVIIDAELQKEFPLKIAFTDNNWLVKELSVFGEKLYFAELTEANIGDPLAKLSETYYHSPNFDFDKLFDKLWAHYSQGAHISIRNSKRKKWEESYMRLHHLSTDDYAYLGDLDPQKFADSANKFREAGVSRSFMLAGLPGTGKTSFVYEVARTISNRVLKIDPSVAHRLSGSDLDFMLEHLKPDVLVFDDFDRVSFAQDTMSLLFLLENIKNRFPHTIIFATVNHFERLDKALVRPGRFDKIIWFELPEADVRRQIAQKYLDSNGVVYTDELLEDIVVKTQGLTPVYIKELCVRLRYEGTDHIQEIMDEFYKTLDEELLDDDDDEFGKGEEGTAPEEAVSGSFFRRKM